jgi:hypothetical protein
MVRRLSLGILALLTLVAGFSLFRPSSANAAKCCTYGVDCGDTLSCCAPGTNEADCSQWDKYYCRPQCDP